MDQWSTEIDENGAGFEVKENFCVVIDIVFINSKIFELDYWLISIINVKS